MSTNRRIYLDFNATAPLSEPARAAMAQTMLEVGNPSSIHAEGRRARDRVERARAQVAALICRPPEQIVFTSGGTEANWLGVVALAAEAERRGLPKVVATTPIEHPSLQGAVRWLERRGWRTMSVDDIATTLPLPGVVAVASVNHELGSFDAATRLAVLAHQHEMLIHVDHVQMAGKLRLVDFAAHSLAISAHKIGGPQGVGALAIALDEGLPVVEGGHHERGRRPGTENTIGVAGFGAAAAVATAELDANPKAWERVRALGDRLEAGLEALGARIHGNDRTARLERIGGTINAGFTGARGHDLVMALDLAGFAVSTGAACTSGTVQPSPVLLALGYPPEQALEAVRFSLGWTTTDAEIDAVLQVLPGIIERARRHR